MSVDAPLIDRERPVDVGRDDRAIVNHSSIGPFAYACRDNHPLDRIADLLKYQFYCLNRADADVIPAVSCNQFAAGDLVLTQEQLRVANHSDRLSLFQFRGRLGSRGELPCPLGDLAHGRIVPRPGTKSPVRSLHPGADRRMIPPDFPRGTADRISLFHVILSKWGVG